MTKEEEFESKWLGKTVRPKGRYYKIPIKDYIVTASLLGYDPDGSTIISIMATDYSSENKHFFTIRIAQCDLEEHLDDFEIIGDTM